MLKPLTSKLQPQPTSKHTLQNPPFQPPEPLLNPAPTSKTLTQVLIPTKN